MTVTINGSGTGCFTDASGNVGVGTSTPISTFGRSLHVYNDANTGTVASNTYLLVESLNRNANIELAGNSTATNSVSFSDTPGTTVAGLASSIGDQNLIFRTGGTTERMRIDSSGNVGIGTSSPTNKLDVATSADAFASIRSTGTIQSAALTITGRQSSSDETWNIISTGSGLGSGSLRFTRGSWTGTPSMLIDSSGNFYVGGTAGLGRLRSFGGSGQAGYFENNGTVESINVNNTANTGFTALRFLVNSFATVTGTITCTTTTTAYNTSSDYRLKYDVQPIASGLATVTALKPVTYKWNSDSSAGEGFIAHELADVIPLAVTGQKDAVDESGNHVHQGVDYSKIVVHLVAAIQELKAQNDELKTRVTALENVQ
jgi:hypothetical protein